MQHAESVLFSEEKVRRTVIPTYMGLIRQLDDHLARRFDFMDERDLTRNNLIVFTSDHGDYLGDHWMGEKELFHEEPARIPMIVVDPSPAADASRGQTDDRLVEAIDLLPSFVEVASPAYSQVRSDLKGHLFDWMTTRRERAIISNESVAQATGSAHEQGYLFGFW